MSPSKLPSLSILNFIICGGGILAFLVLLILPNQQTLAKLDNELERMNSMVEEQKMLFPLYNELFRVAQEEIETDLPSPETSKLEQQKVGDLSKLFEKMAEQSGLLLQSVEADVSSLIDDSGFVRMIVKLQGRFYDLRKFLVNIGGLPYLDHIEQFQIQTLNNAEVLEMSIKLWLAQE